eukprot:scaffold4534_cov85-Amphora_coffeaeformis.AAC.4
MISTSLGDEKYYHKRCFAAQHGCKSNAEISNTLGYHELSITVVNEGITTNLIVKRRTCGWLQRGTRRCGGGGFLAQQPIQGR